MDSETPKAFVISFYCAINSDLGLVLLLKRVYGQFPEKQSPGIVSLIKYSNRK